MVRISSRLRHVLAVLHIPKQRLQEHYNVCDIEDLLILHDEISRNIPGLFDFMTIQRLRIFVQWYHAFLQKYHVIPNLQRTFTSELYYKYERQFNQNITIPNPDNSNRLVGMKKQIVHDMSNFVFMLSKHDRDAIYNERHVIEEKRNKWGFNRRCFEYFELGMPLSEAENRVSREMEDERLRIWDLTIPSDDCINSALKECSPVKFSILWAYLVLPCDLSYFWY
jgi:hypothetical protein